MQIANRLWFTVVLASTLAGPAVTIAREDHVAEGQLLRLDRGAHKIVIRMEHGSQLQCTYNGDTRVVGAGENVAALPAMSRVTVHYAKEDMEYVATEIDVQE